MASFWLEFNQGGQLRQVSFDKDSVSIGRDRSSDFVLDHPTVSRQHALIVSDGGGRFRLVVLSRGGLTALEGEPIEASEVQLYDESSITMGQYTVVFRSEQAPAKPRPQSTSSSGSSGGRQSSMSSFSSADSSGGSGAQKSFGNSFGKGGGGAGSSPDGGEAGSAFQASMGMDGAASQEPEPEPEEPDQGGGGIRSWDEIAADSEREEAEKEKARQESETTASKFNEVRKNSGDGEETNPVIVVGGILGAVLLLGFALLADTGSDDQQVHDEEVPMTEREPVELSVDCIDERECRDDAEQHYARGTELIDQEAIEVGNLFEGYRRLLKAEKYLEEAGTDEIPDDWDQWQEYHDDARSRLDDRFSEFRMAYHQASQSHRYHEMADILEEIEELYPDRTARERDWARQKEREMQAEGVYPRR